MTPGQRLKNMGMNAAVKNLWASQPWAWVCLGLLGAWPGCALAENWPQWRGPFFNGATSETNLPAQWTLADPLVWSAPLPGRSGATPVVWDDHVFVSSPDPEKNLRLFCIQAADGKIRWSRKVGEGDRVQGKNNLASCSPVTDGQRVYALFGSSDLAAYDFHGNLAWQRKLSGEFGAFANLFLYGASPLLYAGKLYVPLLQRNPPTYGHALDGRPTRQSWLICLDPATGRTLWRHERPSDAREEAMEAYTTPLPRAGSNGTELILLGADCVTAHHPDTGAEIWRYSGLNRLKNPGGRIVPSPVGAPGLVFACGPKREMLIALRTGRSGQLGRQDEAWQTTTYVPDVCTPLYYRDKLFVLDGDRQVLICCQPATGEKVWQGRLGIREIFNASPTGADGKIYCVSEEGTVVVVSAGEKFEILATIPMGEGPVMSSVAVAGRRLFIRTSKNLYGIAAQ